MYSSHKKHMYSVTKLRCVEQLRQLTAVVTPKFCLISRVNFYFDYPTRL